MAKSSKSTGTSKSAGRSQGSSRSAAGKTRRPPGQGRSAPKRQDGGRKPKR